MRTDVTSVKKINKIDRLKRNCLLPIETHILKTLSQRLSDEVQL